MVDDTLTDDDNVLPCGTMYVYRQYEPEKKNKHIFIAFFSPFGRSGHGIYVISGYMCEMAIVYAIYSGLICM